MWTDNNIWDIAEGFVSGTLNEEQAQLLQNRLATDTAFAASFQECVNLLNSLADSGKQSHFKAMLQDIHSTATAPRSIPLRTHYWRTAAVAAGVAALTSLGSFWAYNPVYKKGNTQYSVLRRELESIKQSQKQLIQNINTKSTTTAAPPATAKYTGTGFALTNDGYLITNYHVVDGADSVYIQNRDGKYYKAYKVAYMAETDVALLRVEDKDFRFGKSDVPYTFATSKAGLGAKIYTLGYPDDEIVYNEGYISARNGFEGDSMQYRLELPANPGQSGAPVLDAQGNVLAIVTAKGGQNEGNTYAVSSRAVLQLLRTLPKEVNLHLPKVNRLGKMTREQQIEKMQYYTCSVMVYKK